MPHVFDMADRKARRLGLALAREALASGQVVAVPTETVYGLAADATLPLGVARIYEVKGRPRFNPLIVHVPSLEEAEALGVFDPLSRRLAERFWPGPLTLVLPKRAGAPVADLVTAGLDTVAIRMPAHPVALDLLQAYRRPLAAPSANRSGRVSPTTAAHVAADLGNDFAAILDGGSTEVGLESTIVSVNGETLSLLRPGAITRAAIAEFVGRNLVEAGDRVEAPGMLASHYAPAARLRLNATEVEPGEALLAFGPESIKGAAAATAVVSLSAAGNLREAAARLFRALRELDDRSDRIAVMPIPETGLGEAINDRLRRAAAPREAVFSTPNRSSPRKRVPS